MKKTFALAAVAGLALATAACSKPAEEAATDTAADETAVAEDAMATETPAAEDAMATEAPAEGEAAATETPAAEATPAE
jgi:hypothetical protein